MNSLISRIPCAWRTSLGVLLFGLMLSVIYDLGWRYGLSIEARNIAGILLFSCIMLGAAVAYAGARLSGAKTMLSVKIALLVPIVWHIKEICMASKLFGIGPGLYSGIQGYYWAYYGLILVSMGIIHLGLELYFKVTLKDNRSVWRGSGYFFLPLFLVLGIEAFGWFLFRFDLFLFHGYLTGYRALFM